MDRIAISDEVYFSGRDVVLHVDSPGVAAGEGSVAFLLKPSILSRSRWYCSKHHPHPNNCTVCDCATAILELEIGEYTVFVWWWLI